MKQPEGLQLWMWTAFLCTELGLYITDDPNSIFPLYQITERPDRAVGVLWRRVAIFMEGGTDALLVPVTMPILLQSADDYYETGLWYQFCGLSGMVVCLFLHSFLHPYIALTTFHTGMLPLKLVLTITGARAGCHFLEYWRPYWYWAPWSYCTRPV